MSENSLASERTKLEGVEDVIANLPNNTQVTAEQLALPYLLSGLGLNRRQGETNDIATSNSSHLSTSSR